MTGAAFTQGGEIGILAAWFVAVVESERGKALGSALKTLATRPAGGFDDLLDSVTAHAVRDLPSFAIAFPSRYDVRVLVRGEFAVAVEHDGVTERLDAVGVRSWREASVRLPAKVVLGLCPSIVTTASYWAVVGVVPASCIVLESSPDVCAAVAIEPDLAAPGASVASSLTSRDEPAGMAAGESSSPHSADSDEVVPPVTAARGQCSASVHAHLGENPDAAGHGEPTGDTRVQLDEVPAGLLAEEPEPLTAADDVDREGESGEQDDPYADLWHTNFRSIEGAAVRSEDLLTDQLVGSVPSPGPEQPGDHDGHTRSIDSLRAELGAVGIMPRGSGPANAGVLSSMCVEGHPNPPFAATCRRCLSPVRDDVERVARADAGVLVLPNGDRVEVDRTIVVGRNPKAEGLYAGDPPRLVALPDEHDVSRTHLVVEVSGWTATVTDKDSLNGSEVQLPGREPEQLRPNTPVAIVVGTRIVLAGEVVLKLEGG